MTARPRAGEVLPDEGAERRRIPPAIEALRATARHGRTAEIVLTPAQGPATVLPPRDADEPRQDGGRPRSSSCPCPGVNARGSARRIRPDYRRTLRDRAPAGTAFTTP